MTLIVRAMQGGEISVEKTPFRGSRVFLLTYLPGLDPLICCPDAEKESTETAHARRGGLGYTSGVLCALV